jgi:hypothetical protein
MATRAATCRSATVRRDAHAGPPASVPRCETAAVDCTVGEAPGRGLPRASSGAGEHGGDMVSARAKRARCSRSHGDRGGDLEFAPAPAAGEWVGLEIPLLSAEIRNSLREMSVRAAERSDFRNGRGTAPSFVYEDRGDTIPSARGTFPASIGNWSHAAFVRPLRCRSGPPRGHVACSSMGAAERAALAPPPFVGRATDWLCRAARPFRTSVQK